MARVLVVDDDIGILRAFAQELRHDSYDVFTAASGSEALSVATRHPPDVLLVDLNLGDINGLDLIHAVRQRGVDAPTIIVTGCGTFESAVDAVKLGVVDYLLKPL